MAMNSNPFTPAGTASRTVSGASASVILPTVGGHVVRIVNDSTATAFFKFGTAAVTAATTDTPILAGMSEVFTISAADTYVAAIGTSGTLYVTRGSGS